MHKSQGFRFLWIALPCTKTGGGGELRGSLTHCAARREAFFIPVPYLTDLCLMHSLATTSSWNTSCGLCLSFTIFHHWEVFYPSSSPGKPITFCPLPEDRENWASCQHHSPLTYQQATVSRVSITCAELFTSSSPSSHSPVPDHLVDTGKAALQSAVPTPMAGTQGTCGSQAAGSSKHFGWAAGPPTPCPGGRQGVLAVQAMRAHSSDPRGRCCLSLL